jgi:hypothetical protein
VTSTAPPLLQAAIGDLTKGNVEDAINNVLSAAIGTVFPIQGVIQPLLAATVTTPLQAVVDAINSVGPLGAILSNPLQNVVNVINAVQDGGVLSPLSQVVTGLLGPAISGAGAFGAAVDSVGKALGAGNPAGALAAIVNAPATVLDGVLNGGFGPNLAALAGFPPDQVLVVAGGLLSGALTLTNIDPLTVQLAGTINSLQALVQSIAKAIVPPAVTPAVKTSTLAAPAALPAAPAKTVTLETGSSAASVPVKTDTSAAASDAPAEKPESTGTTTKDSSTGSTGTESSSTTKDSTTKPESTETGTDVTTGNKTDPKPTSGSESTKPGGDATDSTTTHEATPDKTGTSSTAASGGAEKSASAGTAKHGKHAK